MADNTKQYARSKRKLAELLIELCEEKNYYGITIRDTCCKARNQRGSAAAVLQIYCPVSLSLLFTRVSDSSCLLGRNSGTDSTMTFDVSRPNHRSGLPASLRI